MPAHGERDEELGHGGVRGTACGRNRHCGAGAGVRRRERHVDQSILPDYVHVPAPLTIANSGKGEAMSKQFVLPAVAIALGFTLAAASANADTLPQTETEVGVIDSGATCVNQFQRYGNVTVWVLWCDNGFQSTGYWTVPFR